MRIASSVGLLLVLGRLHLAPGRIHFKQKWLEMVGVPEKHTLRILKAVHFLVLHMQHEEAYTM